LSSNFDFSLTINRTQIINFLIRRCGYKSYLEIGVLDTKRNFDKVRCKSKEGVDPYCTGATHKVLSDIFFVSYAVGRTFDIIFVDGDHTEKGSYKDIVNSLKHLSKGGTIVCHDCNPPTKKDEEWAGQVWRTILKLRATRPNTEIKTIHADTGLGIIRPGQQDLFESPNSFVDFNFFKQHRNKILNLVTVQEFIKHELLKSN